MIVWPVTRELLSPASDSTVPTMSSAVPGRLMAWVCASASMWRRSMWVRPPGVVEAVTLAKWPGHASPTNTLDHYAHFMPGPGQKGRRAIDSLLGE